MVTAAGTKRANHCGPRDRAVNAPQPLSTKDYGGAEACSPNAVGRNHSRQMSS